jgi:hypothetical protein
LVAAHRTAVWVVGAVGEDVQVSYLMAWSASSASDGAGGDAGGGESPDPAQARQMILAAGTGHDVDGARSDAQRSDGDPAALVQHPAKVMRIGTMVKQLLEEVRAAPLDVEGRTRLRDIHSASIRELEDGLAPELREELERLTLPFDDDRVPTEAELRIAQAQLVGWLEGLFHGIQTALFAQQMAAQAQLEHMRGRALPPGGTGAGDQGMPGEQQQGGPSHGMGQYL